MNTPAHLIMGAAAFARPGQAGVTAAALIGAFLPDASLYFLAGTHIFLLGIPAETVFREYYYSDAWQHIFAIDNSFVLWGVVLGVALWRKVPWAVALAGAALLHLAFDFPVHNHDARMHFWPLTEWRFHSPVSYWDGRNGGDVVGIVESALVLVLTVVLFVRFRHSAWKWAFAGIAALQVAPFFVWRIFF